jgi:hypothetical protein
MEAGMTVSKIIDRLSKVKATGSGKWIALCPAHADRSPSLAVRELDDGRTLIHCFAGCTPVAVLDAIGLQFTDLYAERLGHHFQRERRPFPAAQVLAAVAFEALVASVAASNVATGRSLTEADRVRLLDAASRLQKAVEVMHG